MRREETLQEFRLAGEVNVNPAADDLPMPYQIGFVSLLRGVGRHVACGLHLPAVV